MFSPASPSVPVLAPAPGDPGGNMELTAELGELEGRVATLRHDVREARDRAATAEDELFDARSRFEACLLAQRDQVHAAEARSDELRARVERADAELAAAGARRDELDARVAELEQERVEMEERHREAGAASLKAMQGVLQEERAWAEKRIDSARRALDDARAELHAERDVSADLVGRLTLLKRERDALVGEREGLNSELAEVAAAREQLSARIAELEQQAVEAEEQRRAAGAAALVQTQSALRAQWTLAEERIDAERHAAEEARAALEAECSRREEADRRVTALEAKLAEVDALRAALTDELAETHSQLVQAREEAALVSAEMLASLGEDALAGVYRVALQGSRNCKSMGSDEHAKRWEAVASTAVAQYGTRPRRSRPWRRRRKALRAQLVAAASQTR